MSYDSGNNLKPRRQPRNSVSRIKFSAKGIWGRARKCGVSVESTFLGPFNEENNLILRQNIWRLGRINTVLAILV